VWCHIFPLTLGSLQVIYAERSGAIRGTSLGRDDTPDYRMNLLSGEAVNGIFGFNETQRENGIPCCNNVPVIRSIGFRTTSGRQFGLFGPQRGTAFSYQGAVRAIFGSTTYGFLRAIGVWTDPPPPPPAPPLSPPPPFPPPMGNATASPPPPNLGRSRGPSFGDVNGDSQWNDGPVYRGPLSFLLKGWRGWLSEPKF
jgi:hypothetical protein